MGVLYPPGIIPAPDYLQFTVRKNKFVNNIVPVKLVSFLIPVAFISSKLEVQRVRSSYSNAKYDREGKLSFTRGDQQVYADTLNDEWELR